MKHAGCHGNNVTDMECEPISDNVCVGDCVSQNAALYSLEQINDFFNY